jgi:hypothetical protein
MKPLDSRGLIIFEGLDLSLEIRFGWDYPVVGFWFTPFEILDVRGDGSAVWWIEGEIVKAEIDP